MVVCKPIIDGSIGLQHYKVILWNPSYIIMDKLLGDMCKIASINWKNKSWEFYPGEFESYDNFDIREDVKITIKQEKILLGIL